MDTIAHGWFSACMRAYRLVDSVAVIGWWIEDKTTALLVLLVPVSPPKNSCSPAVSKVEIKTWSARVEFWAIWEDYRTLFHCPHVKHMYDILAFKDRVRYCCCWSKQWSVLTRSCLPSFCPTFRDLFLFFILSSAGIAHRLRSGTATTTLTVCSSSSVSFFNCSSESEKGMRQRKEETKTILDDETETISCWQLANWASTSPVFLLRVFVVPSSQEASAPERCAHSLPPKTRWARLRRCRTFGDMGPTSPHILWNRKSKVRFDPNNLLIPSPPLLFLGHARSSWWQFLFPDDRLWTQNFDFSIKPISWTSRTSFCALFFSLLFCFLFLFSRP